MVGTTTGTESAGRRRNASRAWASTPIRKRRSGVRRAAPTVAILIAVACPATAATPIVPPHVTPGEFFAIEATGFAAGEQVTITITPTASDGANDFGVSVRGLHADQNGRVRAKRRLPRSYFRCAGADSCRRYRWHNNQRVTVALVGEAARILTGRSRVQVPR